MRIEKDQSLDISKKLQLTMSPSTLNFGLSATKIVPGLVITGIVSSVEEAGSTVELGLSD